MTFFQCDIWGEVSHILDVNIFAYDYTGYGMSSGEPSEEALYADIEAAFKYLRDIVGIPWSGLAHLGTLNGSGMFWLEIPDERLLLGVQPAS